MEDLISRKALLEHKTLIPGFMGEYVHVRDILDAPAVSTEQRWIPVTERLPGFECERVLVMIQGDFVLGYPKMDTDRYVDQRWVRYGDNVTHWMPLPEPPKEVQG